MLEQDAILERGIKPKAGESRRSAANEWLPYRGSAGLVVAIDLGTTFSGASYCFLTPGKKPEINDVKRFPGQTTSSSKVPSVILYTNKGEAALFGAEATDGAAAHKILLEGGFAVRYWKLYLKPAHLDLIVEDLEAAQILKLEPLPLGIKAEDVAAKFLAYMASCVGVSLLH